MIPSGGTTGVKITKSNALIAKETLGYSLILILSLPCIFLMNSKIVISAAHMNQTWMAIADIKRWDITIKRSAHWGMKGVNNHGGTIDELESRVNHLESAEASRDSGSVGWTVLGFFIPIVGLILFLVWLRSKLKNSNAAGAGCLAGILIRYVLPFVFPIFV